MLTLRTPARADRFSQQRSRLLPQQQTRLGAPSTDENIVLAVTIQIANRHTPATANHRGGHDLGGHVFEVAPAIVLISPSL
jgi:hypothetical protein